MACEIDYIGLLYEVVKATSLHALFKVVLVVLDIMDLGTRVEGLSLFL